MTGLGHTLACMQSDSTACTCDQDKALNPTATVVTVDREKLRKALTLAMELTGDCPWPECLGSTRPYGHCCGCPLEEE